jgi:hypothetical protein
MSRPSLAIAASPYLSSWPAPEPAICRGKVLKKMTGSGAGHDDVSEKVIHYARW